MKEENINHCDIKPKNILIVKNQLNDYTLKYTDFGVGKITKHTQTFTLVRGTLFYMSPEMFNNCYGLSGDF